MKEVAQQPPTSNQATNHKHVLPHITVPNIYIYITNTLISPPILAREYQSSVPDPSLLCTLMEKDKEKSSDQAALRNNKRIKKNFLKGFANKVKTYKEAKAIGSFLENEKKVPDEFQQAPVYP